MTKSLTDISVRNLKPGDVRREYSDPGCSGLYVIVQPSGKKSFAVRYRFDGTPRKLTLPGATLAAARKLATDALYDVERGIDPAGAKRETRAKIEAAKADTVRALCEGYLKREANKIRTGRERGLILERLVYPAIGDVPLTELKRSHIVTLLDGIEDRNGAKMADLVLAFLRRIFAWHASRVDDFNSPIVRGMSRYDAKANEGTRVLNDDELRRLWTATEAGGPFNATIRFLLLTGARRDEARELPWSEINGTDWHLPAVRNKVKQDLTRPLSRAAMAVLESLPVIDGGRLVFSNDGNRPLSLTAPTAALKARIGAEDWRIHDLRRTCRTLLSRAGVNSDVAERCLGHTIGGVRAVYDKHQYAAEMAGAYEALASLIGRIVNPTDTVVGMRRANRAD